MKLSLIILGCSLCVVHGLNLLELAHDEWELYKVRPSLINFIHNSISLLPRRILMGKFILINLAKLASDERYKVTKRVDGD